MLYVAKLHAYAVLHACECKDKERQSKNKRFQFLWQYVAGDVYKRQFNINVFAILSVKTIADF